MEVEIVGASLSAILAKTESRGRVLDSGSRPAALPGMTGCHERVGWAEPGEAQHVL
jgi:hypothetical protein